MYTSVLSMLDNAASRYQEKVIFQDMENDMSFLDDAIKNSGDIEKGFNFRFYL